MGFFPTDAVNDQEVGPNANGTYFKYVLADDKWIIINNIDISDVAYNEGTWNANSDGATKNVIRDKIEVMDAEAHAYIEANALTLENDLNMGTHKITGVVDPVNNQEAATKKYVDDNPGLVYVDRGDPAAWDYDETDVIEDNTWRDLDLSAIVTDSTAEIVHLSGYLRDGTAGATMYLRKNGNSNNIGASYGVIPVANAYVGFECFVACDSNQVIEYKFSEVFTNIKIVVRGWFK